MNAHPTNILVVALGDAPIEAPRGNVLVVAPALNSWLRRWASDDQRARCLAARRMRAHLEQFELRGVYAEDRSATRIRCSRSPTP
jgi:hypothetical protein